MNNKNIKCKNNKNNNNNNTINKRNMKCKNNYNNKNKNNMFWETTTEIKTWAQVTLFSPHYLTRSRNNNKCKKNKIDTQNATGPIGRNFSQVPRMSMMTSLCHSLFTNSDCALQAICQRVLPSSPSHWIYENFMSPVHNFVHLRS